MDSDNNLDPFQQYIINTRKDSNLKVNVVVTDDYDEEIETLMQVMQTYKWGERIPFVNNCRDIMHIVTIKEDSTCYLIKIPKNADKSDLSQFFTAITNIKDCIIWDFQLDFKSRLLDSYPNIWIFTNEYPDREMLSEHKWAIWKIDPISYELEPYHK